MILALGQFNLFEKTSTNRCMDLDGCELEESVLPITYIFQKMDL